MSDNSDPVPGHEYIQTVHPREVGVAPFIAMSENGVEQLYVLVLHFEDRLVHVSLSPDCAARLGARLTEITS